MHLPSGHELLRHVWAALCLLVPELLASGLDIAAEGRLHLQSKLMAIAGTCPHHGQSVFQGSPGQGCIHHGTCQCQMNSSLRPAGLCRCCNLRLGLSPPGHPGRQRKTRTRCWSENCRVGPGCCPGARTRTRPWTWPFGGCPGGVRCRPPKVALLRLHWHPPRGR